MTHKKVQIRMVKFYQVSPFLFNLSLIVYIRIRLRNTDPDPQSWWIRFHFGSDPPHCCWINVVFLYLPTASVDEVSHGHFASRNDWLKLLSVRSSLWAPPPPPSTWCMSSLRPPTTATTTLSGDYCDNAREVVQFL